MWALWLQPVTSAQHVALAASPLSPQHPGITPPAHSCSGAQQQPPPPPRITLGFSASLAPVPRSPAGFLALLLN